MLKRGLIVLVVLLIGVAIWAFVDPGKAIIGYVRGEKFHDGKPMSWWASSLLPGDPARQSESIAKLREGKAASLPILEQILSKATDAEARTMAAQLIGETGTEGRTSLPVLVSALSDPEEHVQAIAAKAIEQVGECPENAVTTLEAMLASKRNLIPVLRALAKAKEKAAPAVPAIENLLTHEQADVRWNAARTLGKIGVPAKGSIPALLKQFDDPVALVREHAAESLGDIGPEAKEGIPSLIKAMSDPDEKVRRDAVRALGQIGPVDATALGAIPTVKKLTEDKSGIVKEAALKTLKILSGG